MYLFHKQFDDLQVAEYIYISQLIKNISHFISFFGQLIQGFDKSIINKFQEKHF